MAMSSKFEEAELRLEMERRAREKQEREQMAAAEREAAAGGGGGGGGGRKTNRVSTLHRDSEFTLECPDGRVSPPPAPPPRRPAENLRVHGRTPMMRASKTDAAIRYAPSSSSRRNGETRGANGGVGGGRGGGGRGSKEIEPALGEFDQRILNAKKLGKAPMPSVDHINWYHPSVSRHIAESLLMHRDILNGTFLLRNSSSNSDESLTLSVRCRTALRHYKVHWDGRQFVFGLGKFPDAVTFENHFKQQPMISGDCGVLVKLAYPYPRGVIEPHDYQDANVISAYSSAMEDTMELTTPSLSVNSKEGFLTKLGFHRKNWKIRWFTLVRNELKYFNTKEDKIPLRIINLEEATAAERDDSQGKQHCVRLVLPYRTFYMIAQTEAEAEDWLAIIRWRLKNK